MADLLKRRMARTTVLSFTEQLLEALARVNRQLGTFTIVITHNAAIAGMADRVVRISSGEIVEIQRNERKIEPSELSW